MNLARRRFVELAIGAAAGVTLVGRAPAAHADVVHRRACDGAIIPDELYGGSSDVIEYDSLVQRHRAGAAREEN